MDPWYVLGIDIGTSSCKACAVDAGGAILGVASAPYPILSPRPGWSEQDPGHWIPAVASAVGRLRAERGIAAGQVAALALSSAAHVAVLLDDRDEPLRTSILWNDQRATAESARLVAELGDLVFAQTCNQASPTWTLPQLMWVRDHEPELWRRVRRICLSKDYVIRHLAGRCCTDPATAVSSLLYDVPGGRWSGELCGRLGIDAAILPQVLAATDRVGGLVPALAGRLGLDAGIPVVAGTLDSVAETHAAGAVRPGDGVIRLGTAGGVQLIRPGPAGHPRLISYPCPVAPLWLSQAGTNACGASIDWLGRILGAPTDGAAELVSRLAATVGPGSDGLLFHPYLLGERCPHWDAALRGSFVGLSLGHGPAQLARAVLEGVACSLKDAASVFAEGEGWPEPRTLTAVGGGTRSEVLVRILCDVLDRPIRVDPNADSAYGAALLALQGLDGQTHPRGASHGGPGPTLVRPDPEAARCYARGFAAYRAVHERLRSYHHEAAEKAEHGPCDRALGSRHEGHGEHEGGCRPTSTPRARG